MINYQKLYRDYGIKPIILSTLINYIIWFNHKYDDIQIMRIDFRRFKKYNLFGLLLLIPINNYEYEDDSYIPDIDSYESDFSGESTIIIPKTKKLEYSDKMRYWRIDSCNLLYGDYRFEPMGYLDSHFDYNNYQAVETEY